MSASIAHTPSTVLDSGRGGRSAPTGRIIRSARLSQIIDVHTEQVAPLITRPAASTRRVGLRGISLTALLVGFGIFIGASALDESSVEAPLGISRESLAPVSPRIAKPHGAELRALSVRETARLRATSDDLPFRSLGKVSHTLEVPSVAPAPVKYRERLASFTTAGPAIVPQVSMVSMAAPGQVVPARYVPSMGTTPQSGAHLTSRVLSIIKKHAPKNRNPKLLAEAIVRESLAQNYDPIFVAAVIKTESLFNPIARSHKGAQGLMQIMPATGAWLANRESLPRQKLTDTRHNLQLGITYLKQLEAEYNGDRVFTLVAYNWGPGHVQMASGGKRRIPGECLRYAVRILNDYRRWKSGII